MPTQIALLAHVAMHELRSEIALLLPRLLMIVPEYEISCSTVNETPATTTGDADADAEVDAVLEVLVLLDEEDAVELLEVIKLEALDVLDVLEMLAEVEELVDF